MKKTFLYRILAALIIFLSFTGQADAQKIIYVDSSAHGANDGTSWSNAYKSLMPALTIANKGRVSFVIKVAKGTYYPAKANGNPTTSRDSSFRILRDSIQLQGGYPSGGGVQNIKLNPTILSGDIGIKKDTSDNNYHILTIVASDYHYIIDSLVAINGFLFTGGNANGSGSLIVNGQNLSRQSGAAMVIRHFLSVGGPGANCSPAISNCQFYKNNANYGGAASLDFSGFGADPVNKPTFINCVFKGNYASKGGAIKISAFLGTCKAQFRGCTFSNNISDYGGAINETSGETSEVASKFTECVFTNNHVNISGGAIYADGSAGYLRDTIVASSFEKNTSNINGGACCFSAIDFSESSCNFSNCSFNENSSLNFGGAILFNALGDYAISYSYLSNCSFFKNTAQYGGSIYSNAVSYFGSGTSAIRLNIISSVFANNSSVFDGGVIYDNCNSGNTSISVIKNSLFTKNSSGRKGGVLYSYGKEKYLGMDQYSYAICKPTFINSTFYDNVSLIDSGHIIFEDFPSFLFTDTAKLSNCIIWQNKNYGSGSISALSKNNAVFVLNNSLLQGSVAPGTILNGNSSSLLNKYPNFVDTAKLNGADGIWATADDGLVLRKTSPAVNKGDNSYITDITTDITGAPRIQCTTVDLGAYETKCPEPVSNAMVADQNTPYNLFSVYPNPAHQYTTISFHADVKDLYISLVDMTGRIVYTKKAGDIMKGMIIDIPVGDLTPGAYMLRVATDGKIESKKIIVQ